MPFSRPDWPLGASTSTLGELNELLWALPSSLDPHRIVAALLERSTRLFESPLGAVWLREDDREVLVGTYGFTEKKAEQLWQRLDVTGADPVHLHGSALNGMGGFGKRRLGALVAVPLENPQGLQGWLLLARFEPLPYTDLELQFLAFIVSRVMQSLDNARQYQITEARSRELALLNELAQLLVSTTHLDELLERLVRRMTETFHLTQCSIHFSDAASSSLKLAALYHRDPEAATRIVAFLSERPLRADGSITGEVFRRKQPYVTEDLLADSTSVHPIAQALGPGSVLAMPLLIRGTFIGAMFWFRAGRQSPLTHALIPLATHLANQIAVAVDNARLYARLEEEAAGACEVLPAWALPPSLGSELDCVMLHVEALEQLAAEPPDTTAPFVAEVHGLSASARQLATRLKLLLDPSADQR